MKPLRILFFTDNFPPESNAPANRTYEHCVEWVKAGAAVTVITCNPNFPKGELFPGYRNKLHQTEMMDGIKVVRVWSWITPNRGTVKRILDYLSFAFAGFIASWFHKADIVIGTSPQLFAALGAYMAAVVKRKPWIMEVRDIWPESIQVLGAIQNKRILNTLEGLVNHLYRKATGIVVVTNGFKPKIVAEGIDGHKISVVRNGVNRSRYASKEPNQQIIKQLNLNNKFIVGYIGTHGMAHNLNFILDCAAKITNPDIHFLFVGDGAMKGRLQRNVQELNLTNVTMLDPVAREEVQEYISVIDAALIPLRKLETFKTVIPSKIFENASMGKPILLGVEGESQEIVSSYGAGLCFEPENEADFIAKLSELHLNETRYAECVAGGERLAGDFDRKVLAQKMLNVIYETAGREMPQQSVAAAEAVLD